MVGALLELGFWENGIPKGFSRERTEIALWVLGEPRTRSVCDLRQAAERIQSLLSLHYRPVPAITQGVVHNRGCWRLSLDVGPMNPDVWIVARHPGDAQIEKERWERRGFYVLVVPALPVIPAFGLVVHLDYIRPRFAGRLPCHPHAGSMIQSWH